MTDRWEWKFRLFTWFILSLWSIEVVCSPFPNRGKNSRFLSLLTPHCWGNWSASFHPEEIGDLGFPFDLSDVGRGGESFCLWCLAGAEWLLSQSFLSC